jgi:uncharacterized membrane protein
MLIAKYVPVFTGSMLKFVLGPVTGISLGLSFIEIYACTVLGMMSTVVILSVLGTPAKLALDKLYVFVYRKKRKIFSPRNRQVVKIWRKYGMVGVAFLTPLLLSPPFGTLIAVSFGEKKWKIMSYMLVSGLFWGVVLTYTFQILRTAIP